MKILVRLAFIVPALVLAGPAAAVDHPPAITGQSRSVAATALRYRALDRMIRTFAARSQAHAVRKSAPQQTVLASR